MQYSVLVIEDDEIFRELIVRHLGDEYVLLFANTLEDAADALNARKPDCIMLDMRLPDGDGIEFLPRPVQNHIPVIMCTAHGSESLAVRAMKAGAADYLVKNGLGKLELRRAIKNAIEQARLRELLRKQEAEKDELIHKLRAALKDIETLHGIIPICANCKKVRDDEGYWHLVEAYISEHTGASFTHGLCPTCLQTELDNIGGGPEEGDSANGNRNL